MTKNSLEQSRHNLRNLLLTYPGERVGNSEFGCRLREVCFEQDDENLPTTITKIVIDAVAKFLPYISILNVSTFTEENQKETVYVTTSFSTTLDPTTNQSLTLNTSDGSEIDDEGSSTGGTGGTDKSGGY
jgi:phage baseplate assembly protein W